MRTALNLIRQVNVECKMLNYRKRSVQSNNGIHQIIMESIKYRLASTYFAIKYAFFHRQDRPVAHVILVKPDSIAQSTQESVSTLAYSDKISEVEIRKVELSE